MERKNGDDWVLACRNVVVAGLRCAGRGRKTLRECMKDDMYMSWVYTLNGWCSGICGEASYREKRLTLAECGSNGHFENKW